MFKLKDIITILAIASFLIVGFRSVEPANEPSRTISVNGEAEIRVVPDEVVLTLGIHTWDANLETAKRENDRILQRVLNLTNRYDLKPEQVKSDYMYIQPHYESWDYPERVEGYSVRRTVVVTLKDISRMEDYLSSVLGTGVNYIHGIDFRTTELRKYRDQARELAIQAAKEKAVDLSGALDMRIGDPLTIQEGQMSWWAWSGSSWWGSGYNTMTQNVVQVAGGSSPDLDNGLAPGQIVIKANVTAVFEMESAN
ncbi:MAG: SIMPL domain-containing protein [Anaerolineales bacterium]|nr:SIMPL domain-containing protein [Anaerolineales bacterium]